MCVAGLNVSTQPCAHRWYELVRPCHPANNLQNCPEKLKLEGWENRNETCPWCESGDQKVHASTHKLFGDTSSASSTTSSPTSPDIGSSRSQRSGSDATINPLSRASSTTSMESERGQKHRNMNERLDLYLRLHPHELLPSAAKNYPTYPQTTTDDADPGDAPLIRRSSSGLSKQWKKSVRMSMGMFKI